MLVMLLPETPPESKRQVRYESAVTFHVLDASRVKLAALAASMELIAPVSDDPF